MLNFFQVHKRGYAMVKIIDVAKKAGVSVATVSRVINGTVGVSNETVKRVQEAIAALNYIPNLSARNLRRFESGTILVVAPNITNPYYTHILAGIGEQARQFGYSTFIYNTMGDKNAERDSLQLLAQRRADGAILLALGAESEEVKSYALEYPVVLCSEYNPSLDVERVSIDNYSAAYEATQFLIGLGHTRIGTISSRNDYISTKLRLKGYRDALKAAGIALEKRYIAYASADYSFESGQALARALLSAEKRPTALFCISDMLALGAIAGANQLGLDVPKDVTVVGFDDVASTTMFHPYITTVAQPCYELGVQSMKLLQRRMTQKHDTGAEKVVILPHKIVVRESSAPPVGYLDFSSCFLQPVNQT